ncbi:RHS repeat-associated core domain-containing protein [Variovorax sp. MHTC-1]|uniref:RHS repeat-associated core domain-containing protein n=1 Tax=Variovorax sp. MHTC-1 TaxID=2495593 RepID=UPI001C8DA7E9
MIDGIAFAVHPDHLGTPRRITAADGQVLWQWAYSAFGDEEPTVAAKRFTSATTNPTTGITGASAVTYNLRYPGQYADTESGLFYNYFRSYSSTTGRYTQSDPIGLDGGWNRFGYVDANPLSLVDPEGLRSLGPPSSGAYYARGVPPRTIQHSDLPTRAAYEAAASMIQTPNPPYPGAPLDLPCIQWDCSGPSGCKPNDIKSPTDFLPPARTTAETPPGCRCVSAGRDPAFQLPFDPSIDPYTNANEVRDNWRSGSRLIRR